MTNSSWANWENFFFPFMTHQGTCVESTHKGVLSTPWGNFFTTLKGVASLPWTRKGAFPWYCTSLAIWLMVLSYEGVSLVIFDQLSDVFDALNPLGMFWGSLCL